MCSPKNCFTFEGAKKSQMESQNWFMITLLKNLEKIDFLKNINPLGWTVFKIWIFCLLNFLQFMGAYLQSFINLSLVLSHFKMFFFLNNIVIRNSHMGIIFGKKTRWSFIVSILIFSPFYFLLLITLYCKNQIFYNSYISFFYSAADRSISDSVSDAKEGLVVSCVDTIETYRTHVSF